MIPARCWFDLFGHENEIIAGLRRHDRRTLAIAFNENYSFKNGFDDAPPAVMQIRDLDAPTRIADEA